MAVVKAGEKVAEGVGATAMDEGGRVARRRIGPSGGAMAVEPRDVLVAPPRMVGGGEAWEAAEADVLDDGGAEGRAV